MISPSWPASRTVAVGFVATSALMRGLAEQLGDRWAITDIRDAPRTVDVVLVGRCSPQAVTELRREFPLAQLVVVEPVDEPDRPDVCRCLSAGAARHVIVSSLTDVVRAVTGLEPSRPATDVAA